MPGETISPEHAASLVKSGMWLDYGTSNCQPDVFDRALAARKARPGCGAHRLSFVLRKATP